MWLNWFQFFHICRKRCRMYWVHGSKKGEVDAFVDNLPGYPDNIHNDGQNYWIAISSVSLPNFLRSFVYIVYVLLQLKSCCIVSKSCFGLGHAGSNQMISGWVSLLQLYYLQTHLYQCFCMYHWSLTSIWGNNLFKITLTWWIAVSCNIPWASKKQQASTEGSAVNWQIR